MKDELLCKFVTESNAIERILREPTDAEMEAHRKLLLSDGPDVEELSAFALAVQPDGHLRVRVGMNVRVGNHLPPRGGPKIKTDLNELLIKIVCEEIDPYAAHVQFETLHPFMDGNGRTGRALWLWHAIHAEVYYPHLSFLHQWYYRSLDVNQ